MTRSVPEIANGATVIDVQEQDVKILEGRGWVVSKSALVKEEKKPEPVKEEVAEEKVEEKPAESKKKSKF
ncbi:MAG: hypothetical protein MJZ11_08035 [Lachnospiraceae bacterium]|nr:hypothetical protein [Lachnospiraceae bacterium]